MDIVTQVYKKTVEKKIKDVVTQVYKKLVEKKIEDVVYTIRLLVLNGYSMNAYHAGMDLDKLAGEGWVINLVKLKAKNVENINFYQELLKYYQRGLDQAGELSLASKVGTITKLCLERINIEIE